MENNSVAGNAVATIARVAKTKSDIEQVAVEFSQAFLEESRSIDMVVFAEKLKLFAEKLREIGSVEAYAVASIQPKGQDLVVLGATVTATKGSDVYEYSEAIQLAEQEFSDRTKKDKSLIDAMKKLEVADGTAKPVDRKPGQLRITIPGGVK